MAVSLEALAMAGADYLEFSLDAEEWESQDLMQAETPPHLLVEEEEEQGAFPTTHFFRSLHAKDDDAPDADDRITVKCKSKVGGIIDESIEKCLSSIRLVVRAIIRLLLMDFKSSF
ncbi:uncharacterized protein LOC132165892 [Corylus avellana]|uniref:uncharacterized protein LOC132165892 n=1 Tax=Corylus avellana TaxID=13451 RepID=UPI00286B99B9|nr:uncharacterized protein LOC132165892 [Corylus avellana]